MDTIWKKYENCILSFAVMGASVLLMGAFFDFYYDLNDDTMMRDILSGVYSGTPDGHNMQTLYPLGALLALCYRLAGSFPWYGAFLLLCQFGCFFAVGTRLCKLTDAFFVKGGARLRLARKLLVLVVLTALQWGSWLTHMVNIQYTITAGMLAGTAIFLFLTGVGIPSLLCFLLAFWLRSEMALLVLPLLGLAGAFRWWEDRPVFAGKNLKKYGGLLLLLFAGMGLSLLADSLAYGGEWRTFRQLFDDRTTIYDYYPEVVTDDRYDADLKELGASYGARILLENYDFGLDETIDAQLFSDVAAYAKESVGGARDWSAIFREKLLLYRYRSFHGDDAPYNGLVWLGYAANIIAAVMIFLEGKKGARHRELLGAGVELFLVFLTRSALWMFILMRGRDPERITHPLYLAEFCLLAGMFLRRVLRGAVVSAESAAQENALAQRVGEAAPHAALSGRAACYMLRGIVAALVLLSAWGLCQGIPALQADQAKRREVNREWEAIDSYCRAHPDTFYFEDVYSTVAFSGKLLERRANTTANYDIAGGWMCKSPLYREKLAAFGVEDAADALAEGKACFIMSGEEITQRGLAWLAAPFAEKGMAVSIEEADRIGEYYGVYQVIPVSE